jgi:hypothetical protein
MQGFQTFDPSLLDSAGLNRQAVFNIADLPADLVAAVQAASSLAHSWRQLILIGHAGKRLWESVKAAGIDSADPIDDFTVQTVRHWFAEQHPHNAFDIIYPGTQAIGLQRLGQLAGWHHASPLLVGIDSKWGTWFAYRAVVLADTMFEPSKPVDSPHPCYDCAGKPCIAGCPAGALDSGKLDLQQCIAYRKRADSLCKATCLARIACPMGSEHRYDDEQIRHTYSLSMQAIERYC